MASSHNIELEAAKFLHKLIQDSKDEPAKLATKLYVILQHMKTSGKEHSMPYQVISRAMETVVNQHGLDIEALKSSRLPHAGGIQMEDSGSAHLAGSSQVVGVSNDSKASLVENEMSKYDAFTSGKQLGGSNSASQAVYQGSGTRSNRSFDHESPSSLDSKSGNSQSHDRSETMNQRDVKSNAKRKRGESSFSWEQNMDNSQIFDTHGTVDEQTRKMSKVEMPGTGDIENLHVGLSSDAYTTSQGGWQNSEVTAIRPPANRDTGKSVAAEDLLPSGPLFKEQQLKQLRAQCLVFLALRNGLMPKKLHVDIALGNIFPKDDGFRRELFDQKGRTHSLSESGSIHEVSAPSARMDNPNGRLAEMDFSSKETEMPRLEDKISNAVFPDGQKLLMASKIPDAQVQNQVSGSHSELASSSSGLTKHAPSEIVGWAGIINRNDISNSTFLLDELYAPDQEEGNMQPSPKYTMSQKWIMDRQNKRLLVDRSWGLKQQKADQAIGARFNELKESVSSSEDISTKTKSVIELKKLQLLNRQRRLRSEFLYNFFKPIATDVENLKSYKKHKHGRRIKQLEKYEQKMKEERQRRIRERQKEFFGEIEVHKERLEDLFKARRERWKGFNRYVKEFHKRKERFHREKIDKIQREKINLLKINDVEGYLRMVQDAKSDRVKQLLKETEKYLQKLGSKLKEAKSLTTRFENEADETHMSTTVEDETSVENEDESDQAKHYLESNEKYYLMAHSIKENINEQPASLKGGKLREYQMNGLRWLLSLYNNHLNGILADEMGLGKTVQVISLICYLMETKNDRGPFLVVVPSSVLPGWVSEINFWAPAIQKIVYCGPPEERRKLFKEQIVHQKFNVLLTTYEYLMNKHDRPKLSKILWHYIIIDEGHRIKNASCKLNADLKHYNSSHRLLLTGTPLQNNLEELWALLNFLLPNIFNSSEDFSQWFNKPFQSNGDNSAEEALLSEEENLLIINRLHQVLRPFVLRRLKHKVENELPEKIERLIRCEASAYQKLLMKRVEDNLGSLGNVKSRAVHNSVMELRNICNHPYLSQLHTEEVNSLIPEHYLPPVIRLCGKLEMLDRLLPKLKATDHRVLFFSTMTRLLDVMEDYLTFKGYKYLRLDGHTSGGDRGALIDGFNKSDSPYFIFLLSIRAGGVGVNLQAADTVIIFDTDWNPQVDLQAQARAHRIGQKRDVLVLRFETVNTVEEQVRASAEHKLGVANQSITAGFFDNNTSAEDRKEYLESLLRESKKEEAAPVLDDDALNDVIARRESEIDIFESIDKQRKEDEMETWKSLVQGPGSKNFAPIPPIPSRLVTEDDLKLLYEAMKINNVPMVAVESNVGMKRKGGSVGGFDTQQYGRGKRAREVRSYEEQLTEEEFEKMCQTESTDSPRGKEEGNEQSLAIATENILGGSTGEKSLANATSNILAGSTGETSLANDKVDLLAGSTGDTMLPTSTALALTPQSLEPIQKLQQPLTEVTEPVKRGRGRPKRADKTLNHSSVSVLGRTHATGDARSSASIGSDVAIPRRKDETTSHSGSALALTSPDLSVPPGFQTLPASNSAPMPTRGRGRGRSRGRGAGRGRRVESMLHGADSSISTQRTNALASLSGDPVASNLVTVLVSSVNSDARVPKPIEGSSSNLEPALSMQSDTTVVQPSPVVSLQEGTVQGIKNKSDVTADLDAPPGFGSGSHVQSLNISEDSLGKKIAAVKNKAAIPVNIPSSTSLGRPPAQNHRAVSSVYDGSESPSIASVDPGRNKYPEGRTYAASATMKTAPLDANRPLSPHLVCSTVEAQGASVLSPPATLPVKRQGRKMPNRGETPRRRGRRHVQALAATDGSSARSTRSTPPQIEDSSGSKIIPVGNKCDVVVQEQPHFNPSVAHSSASTSQEKRKETSGIGGSVRKQTTDVTDVARVMKEIFSETSLLKHKVGEPSETTVTNEPDGKSAEKMNMLIVKTSKAENVIQPADKNLEVETFVSSFSVEKQKSGSSVMIDEIIKTSADIEASVPQSDDITPQGTMLIDTKIPMGGELVETELKVATSTDPNLGTAASGSNVSEENKISDSSLLVPEIVKPSPGFKAPVDQSDITSAQGTVAVDPKNPVDEDLLEINIESQPQDLQDDGYVQTLPALNADFAGDSNKRAGPPTSPSVAPGATKMPENMFGLKSKDSSETVPLSSGDVIEDSTMPSASNGQGSPKKTESPEIHKSSGVDPDCLITPTGSAEVDGVTNFSGTSTEVPEKLNDSVTESTLEMSVSISEKVLEKGCLTSNSDDLKCVLDPETKDALGVRCQWGDNAGITNVHLNPTGSSDTVAYPKAEIIPVGHTLNCPPNISTEGALADQIVIDEASSGHKDPGSSHNPIKEKKLISDVDPIGLVANKDGGTELSVVAGDAENDFVKIPGVEADSSVIQLASVDVSAVVSPLIGCTANSLVEEQLSQEGKTTHNSHVDTHHISMVLAEEISSPSRCVLPESTAFESRTTEPLLKEEPETNLSTEVAGEKIDGDKSGTIPLIPVEQMNVHPMVGSHELETSSEEFKRSPSRTDEISHVDDKSFATNQTVKEVETKSKRGESSEDQICKFGPNLGPIQSSMLHTGGKKAHSSNENSISLVHKDYGSPLSDSDNTEQDSEESVSVQGVDSCKVGVEANTADTEMEDADDAKPLVGYSVDSEEKEKTLQSSTPNDDAISPAPLEKLQDSTGLPEKRDVSCPMDVIGHEGFESETHAHTDTSHVDMSESMSDGGKMNISSGQVLDVSHDLKVSHSLSEDQTGIPLVGLVPENLQEHMNEPTSPEGGATNIVGFQSEENQSPSILPDAPGKSEDENGEKVDISGGIISGKTCQPLSSIQSEDENDNNLSQLPDDVPGKSEDENCEKMDISSGSISGKACQPLSSIQSEDENDNNFSQPELRSNSQIVELMDFGAQLCEGSGVEIASVMSVNKSATLQLLTPSLNEQKNTDDVIMGLEESKDPEADEVDRFCNSDVQLSPSISAEEKKTGNDMQQEECKDLEASKDYTCNIGTTAAMVVDLRADVQHSPFLTVEQKNIENIGQVETAGREIADVSAGCLSEPQVQLPPSVEQVGGHADVQPSLSLTVEPKNIENEEQVETAGCEIADVSTRCLSEPQVRLSSSVEQVQGPADVQTTSSPTVEDKERVEISGREIADVSTGCLSEPQVELPSSAEQVGDLPFSLPVIEEEMAENPSDERKTIGGEASGATVSVQPEDLCGNPVETEEPTQMGKVGDESDHSEDNLAISVVGEKEESKDQREHLSSAQSSEEETKSQNPSDERNMTDGGASGIALSVQSEDMSRNLVETEEPARMGEVDDASNRSEDNVTTGVLGEKEESTGQREHLSSALSSEIENKESFPTEDPTVGGLDEPEPKCSASESDIKGDDKKCVGSSESSELESEVPPAESVNSISEGSSEPSNSLVSKENKSEESKGIEDV